MMRGRTALVIAVSAVMIALTAVFTYVVHIPIVATGGYFNFSSVIIGFASAAFGPWIGLVAGGVGTALGDLLGGFAYWAPLTLVAHGLEGLLIGLLGQDKSRSRLVIAWAAGGIAMVAVYFFGEWLLYDIPWLKAAAEVPWNIGQSAVGALVGIPLFYAVRRAYPPIARLTERATWKEG